MTVRIGNVTFDCADPYVLAEFWSRVTTCPIAEGDEPGDDEVDVVLTDGTHLVFIQVPEPKTVKNRVHVCLRPDGDRDTEIERVLGIGARLVADRREGPDSGWGVFHDPEGNEFCLLSKE